jgi:predicted transposase/invertase (TIGR01784 family)
VAKESLDQWIRFLKTGDIPESFDAQGLPEARERLRVDNLPEKERREYQRELERRMVENDVMNTYFIDGKDEGLKEGKEEGLREGKEEGLKEGKKKREIEIARNMKGKNYPIEDIIDMTGLSAEEIAEL